MECPKCGTRNRGDAQFCGTCGFPFADLEPAPPTPEAAAISAANAEAAARSVDRGGKTPEDAERAGQDAFFAARMEEREWHEKRRRLIEAAGGSEAYEAGIQQELAASKHRRRVQSMIFQSILLVAALIALVLAIGTAQDWARVMTALPGLGATSAVTTAQAPGIGQAFGVAIALLLACAIMSSSVARLARKSIWGVLAALAVVGLQVAMLSPYLTVQAGVPVGSGIGLGVAAFAVTSLSGGLLGAWYGGQDNAV